MSSCSSECRAIKVNSWALESMAIRACFFVFADSSEEKSSALM